MKHLFKLLRRDFFEINDSLNTGHSKTSYYNVVKGNKKVFFLIFLLALIYIIVFRMYKHIVTIPIHFEQSQVKR